MKRKEKNWMRAIFPVLFLPTLFGIFQDLQAQNSRIGLEITSGAGMGMGSWEPPNPVPGVEIKTAGRICYEGGIKLRVVFAEKAGFTLGIQYSRKTFSWLNLGEFGGTVDLDWFHRTNNLEIPICGTFKIVDPKGQQIYVGLGPLLNIHLSDQSLLISYDHLIDFEFTQSAKIFTSKKIQFGAQVLVGVTGEISDKVYYTLEPSYRYYFNPFIKDEYTSQSSLSLTAGIGLWLNK